MVWVKVVKFRICPFYEHFENERNILGLSIDTDGIDGSEDNADIFSCKHFKFEKLDLT